MRTDGSIILLFLIAFATIMTSDLERQLLRLDNLTRGNQWLQEKNLEKDKLIEQLKKELTQRDERIQQLEKALIEFGEKFIRLQ